MKRIHLNVLLIALCCMMSCASKRTVRLTERHPNKALKTYQKVSTYQVCRENCRIVKTKKKRIEYYETGKMKSYERSVNELSLDGQYHSQRIYSKLYDEKGILFKKVRRDDLEGTVSLYENGKLKSKKSFDQ
jgi:antitoxin component YwqK of YwqJK toxin-antitoxin module